MASTTHQCKACGRSLPDGVSQCPSCATMSFERVPSRAFPVIAGHKILRSLGEGGMGAVYLAEDEKLGRTVAVKMVLEAYGRKSGALDRFMIEAQTMAKVDHPNIVSVHAFGEVDGNPYFIMQFVEGEDLSKRIEREERLSVQAALRFLVQTIKALDAAWEKGIIHRDVKPSNILIDKKDRVKVADFGLAKPVKMEDDPSLTKTGFVVGTPQYMAPEQVRGEAVDFRADIYALGIMLYQMLAGRHPYGDSPPLVVIDLHLHEPLPDIRKERPEIPGDIQHLMMWMTEKDPGRRPSSYGELLAAIEPLIEGRTSSLDAIRHRRAAASKPGRARKGLSAAIGLFALVAFLLVWKALHPAGPPEKPPTPPDQGMVVAITPFYGPDPDSAKEGRVMAALVERSIRERFGPNEVKVLGIEDTATPVRDSEAAKALGRSLGATTVIWGEAYALRGETEIQPFFTLVPRDPEPEEDVARGRSSRTPPAPLDPLAGLEDGAIGRMVMEAQAPNQIELRKTSASGVRDMVLFLAGMHALYRENNAQAALALFDEAPRTADSLRYRAQALIALKRGEEAIATLLESIALDPANAQNYATLGDLHVEAGRLTDAARAYQKAASSAKNYIARRGAFQDGLLYIEEVYTYKPASRARGFLRDTAYLLAVDPETGAVRRRFYLPGLIQSFASSEDAIQVSVGSRLDGHYDATVSLTGGTLEGPLFYGKLWARSLSRKSAWNLPANFMDDLGSPNAQFKLTTGAVDPDAPQSLDSLEQALRAAVKRDATQPWHLFFLGQTLWAQGRPQEAEATWRSLLDGAFDATPYFEFASMALFFERLGQREWADRAYSKTVEKRASLAQPPRYAVYGDRFNAPFLRDAALECLHGSDLERAHVWFTRARDLVGVGFIGHDLAAAAWAKYFQARGDVTRMKAEQAWYQRARAHPFNSVEIAWAVDFAVYGLVAATTGFWLLALVVLFRTARVASAGPFTFEPDRAPEAGKSRVGRAGHVFAWLWPGGLVVFGGLVLWGWMFFHHTLVVQEAFVLSGVFLLCLLLVVRSRRKDPRLFLSSIPARARWAIAISACLMAVVMVCFWAVAAHMQDLWATFGLVPMDAIGHPSMVEKAERWMEEHDTLDSRFVAATVNHLAGKRERARQLYRTLPRDERARKNLDALEQGAPVPAVPVTLEDIRRARTRVDWRRLITRPNLAIIVFYHTAFVLCGALFVGFRLVRPRETAQLPRPDSALKRWICKAGFLAVPGLFDLRRGHPLRGYAIVLLGFASLPLFHNFILARGDLPAPGFVAGVEAFDLNADSLMDEVPFPNPDSARTSGELLADLYWTLFWAYPYARIFWPVVLVCATLALALHLTRVARIIRLYSTE